MKRKALVLVSGGLDSALAVGLMKKQGLDVEIVSFFSPFSTGIKNGTMGAWVRKIADHFNVKAHFIMLREEFLEKVFNPAYGYGTGLNPCKDCKIFYFTKSKELMESIGASFIATGEVLGQRPMSQLKEGLQMIEKNSPLCGYIVRPLSGKILEASLPEKEGIIDREKMCAIQGRGREEQFRLAEEFGIQSYPQPAGGCILTDKAYATKMQDMYRFNTVSIRHCIALQCGRVYRFANDAKVIIGRDERENELLEKLADDECMIFSFAEDKPGPLLLFYGNIRTNYIEHAARLVKHYSKERLKDSSTVSYYKKANGTSMKKNIDVGQLDEDELILWSI